jgi:molecular chaperone GrpE
MNNEPLEEPQDQDPQVQDDAAETVDVEALKAERNALQDRLLRTAAEFDNYRKRIDRERREQSESAASSMLAEILPVVDNLERALQAPSGPEAAGYRAGVELILRQLADLLRKRGVTPIDVVGADFDPRVHQAVSQETSDAHRDGEVMEELQRGYMLGDRLLRPAMVKVAKS